MSVAPLVGRSNDPGRGGPARPFGRAGPTAPSCVQFRPNADRVELAR